MKNLILFISFLTASPVQASQLVYKGPYSKFTVVQGSGKTLDEAKADAEKGIPNGWQKDPGNSPAMSCSTLQRDSKPTKPPTKKQPFTCDKTIAGNKILYSFPIVPTSTGQDKKEREAYEQEFTWLKK